MDKYIPLKKRSKKAQKEYHKQQRGTWEINPVTRSVPNGKGYDRNKIKQQDRRGGRLSGKNDSLPFFSWMIGDFRELDSDKYSIKSAYML